MDTLKNLRDEVLYQLDEPTDTGSTKTNVNNAINQAHVQRLTQVNWPFMIWPPPGLNPETFTTVANQKGYSLHPEFHRPYYFKNQTIDELLIETPSRNIGPQGFDWSVQADGKNYVLQGISAVQNQPSAASVMTIVSSSVNDVGSTKAVIVRGETTDGVTIDTINPNGTTPVAGLVSFTRILNVTKSSAWSGTMTMTSNAAAVTNLKLFASEFGRNYQQLMFLSIPSGAQIIEYRFYRKPSTLSNDNDIPDIPAPYGKILVWDALMVLSAYDGRIDSGRMAVWRDNQTKLELAMQQAFLEGQSIEAQPRYVRYINNDYY